MAERASEAALRKRTWRAIRRFYASGEMGNHLAVDAAIEAERRSARADALREAAEDTYGSLSTFGDELATLSRRDIAEWLRERAEREVKP